MSFWDDVGGIVSNAFNGSDDKDLGDTLLRVLDPIGNYGIKKAYANDSYSPGEGDRETAQERLAAESRAPTWKNPLVQGAKSFGDAKTAAGAASKRYAQNKQLNRLSASAPEYWQGLVNKAAQYTAQGKSMQDGDSYGEAYIKQQVAGNLNAWGNVDVSGVLGSNNNSGYSWAGGDSSNNINSDTANGDAYASNNNGSKWYQYDTYKSPQYYDTSYT